MAALSKPIPPLYTVYFLRSTIRIGTLYIGSTPNPPRRLKQHNGEIKGGATRTSTQKLRPWEMVGLVSGFPGMVAALKFEWALNNPHVSLHIPKASRITVATKRKRSGRPKRPRPNIKSIIANAHLLLRVPSFARWPLKIHFFTPEVYEVWTEHCATVSEPLSKVMSVHTDFPPPQLETNENTSDEPPSSWGIHALPLNYLPMKGYLEKTRSLYSFEREGSCAVCKEVLEPGEGLYATCSNDGCECTGHLSCWSRHLLGRQAKKEIIPVSGRCPKCKGQVVWGDMMKEMSLRLRGQKEVDKLLLKKTRKRRAATAVDSDDEAD